MKNLLAVFMRFPEEGKVKTRLMKAVSGKTAAELHKAMSLDVIENTQGIEWETIVFLTPKREDKDIHKLLGAERKFAFQQTGNLGEKMDKCFQTSFTDGYESVVLIGTDSPDLGSGILSQAFRSISDDGNVIGPGFDGGYYLIGFHKDDYVGEVFYGPEWGEDSVLTTTLEIFRNHGHKPHILPLLHDIDTPEDLVRFVEDGACGTRGCRIAEKLKQILIDNSETLGDDEA